MNIIAFNYMMAILSWEMFSIWFWTVDNRAKIALLVMLVFWGLGNLTKGKVRRKK